MDTRKRFTTEKIKQHPFWLENCNAQGLNPNGVSCSPPEVGKELRKSDSSQRISDPNATNCPDKVHGGIQGSRRVVSRDAREQNDSPMCTLVHAEHSLNI